MILYITEAKANAPFSAENQVFTQCLTLQLQFSGMNRKPIGIRHNADKMSREQMERGCGLCLNMVPMYAPPT